MVLEDAPPPGRVVPGGHDDVQMIGHETNRERARKGAPQVRPQPPHRRGLHDPPKPAPRVRDEMKCDGHTMKVDRRDAALHL